MEIQIIPMLTDNYCYALISPDKKACLIDPAEFGPATDYLSAHNLELTMIINTHHHFDHIGGNEELKNKYGCRIYAPRSDLGRIKNADEGLAEGDTVLFEDVPARVIETPGHTSGHICLYFETPGALFCGDTVFSMGCGRLFEGTPEQMWDSFSKILALPDETLIYPGHEYTYANGQFCLSIEPDNQELQARVAEVKELRAQGKPTIPVSLATEKQTNVFLRAGSAQNFAKLRALKDAQ
jgi:hydroxyacylglutathione hydrolase